MVLTALAWREPVETPLWFCPSWEIMKNPLKACRNNLVMKMWSSHFPKMWAERSPPGLAISHIPILDELMPGTHLVIVWQYSLPQEAKIGFQVYLQSLLVIGLLQKHQSSWNTPLLPVKKPGTKTTDLPRACEPPTKPQQPSYQWSLTTHYWASYLQRPNGLAV